MRVRNVGVEKMVSICNTCAKYISIVEENVAKGKVKISASNAV